MKQCTKQGHAPLTGAAILTLTAVLTHPALTLGAVTVNHATLARAGAVRHSAASVRRTAKRIAQVPASPAPLIPQAQPNTSTAPALPGASSSTVSAAPPAQTTAPSAPAGQAVTLDQVLAIALRSNSSVVLAQERLRKAQEQIEQVNAEARPQIRIDLDDTLSSVRTFGASAGGAIQSVSLPGGGTIPVVVDQGGGSSSGFAGGGGGGTTTSSGGSSLGGSTTTGGSGTTSGGLGTTTGGLGTTTGGTGAGTLGTGTGGLGTGGGTGTSGVGTSGGTGAGGVGTSSAGTATGLALVADVPPIVQQYAATATQRGTPIKVATPHDDQSGTGGSGTGTGGTGVSTGTGTTVNRGSGNYNNYSGRLSVTQYLDIFGLVGAARDVENITRDFYATDLERVANETALSVKNTYFNVLKAQSQVSVQQEQVNYATENLRIAQARFTAGAAAQFDVVTAQTTLSNAQQQLISAQNNLDITRANLNNLVGVRQDVPLDLQTPPLPPLNQPVDLTQSLNTAFARRPELRQANNNIVIAKRLVKLAGSSLLPTLGVVGAANYSGPSATSTGSGISTRHDTYNLSLELGIPLSDGGTAHSRVRSAQIDLETQNITKSQLVQNVELEVRQALINVRDAQAQSASAAQGVTQAEEAVRLAQVRYQNGLGTLLDVTNAQAQLATARTNLAAAQFGYQTSLAQLTRAEGGR